jgi:ABC-2 type transport system ATP-binding protein
LGKSGDDFSIKEDLGILFDQPTFHEDWTPTDIERAMRPFYKHWDSQIYLQYLDRFALNPRQKFKTLSRGMKMKLGLAVTLSHDAKLLLLDELHPGLTLLCAMKCLKYSRIIWQRKTEAYFFSTHITSDLEKVADYIVYIHKGQIVYSGLKDMRWL